MKKSQQRKSRRAAKPKRVNRRGKMKSQKLYTKEYRVLGMTRPHEARILICTDPPRFASFASDVAAAITIPKDIVERAAGVLKKRGSNLESYLTLQIARLCNSQDNPLRLADTMPFGKYAGCMVEQIVRGEPSYIRWLLQNTQTRFDPGTIRLLEQLTGQVQFGFSPTHAAEDWRFRNND